jgi:hypothetical protein
MVVALEGGYNLDALAFGSDAVCRLLLGDEPEDDPLGPPPDQLSAGDVASLLQAIRQLHQLD